jgi:hypothetical protein
MLIELDEVSMPDVSDDALEHAAGGVQGDWFRRTPSDICA